MVTMLVDACNAYAFEFADIHKKRRESERARDRGIEEEQQREIEREGTRQREKTEKGEIERERERKLQSMGAGLRPNNELGLYFMSAWKIKLKKRAISKTMRPHVLCERSI